MIRPERIALAVNGEPAENRFAGTVVDSAFLGNATILRVRLGERVVLEARLPARGGEAIPAAGQPVTLSWPVTAPVLLCD